MDYEYKRKNAFKEGKAEEIFKFAEGYKAFLNTSKTERDACRTAVQKAVEAGFSPFSFSEKLKVGDKRYFANRDKNLFLLKVGEEDAEKCGVRIMVAHADSPRLDLKPNPLYESDELAYFKTHYYGGIKKYQWTTIPLSLHGTIVLKDGTKKDIFLGENEDDPVFCVSDLLPHLAGEQNSKPLAKAITGENLNVLIGEIPMEGAEKDAVKAAVLKILHESYGMDEEDFQCAELCLVPAGKSRDAGVDRSMILGYGHDDKVCAYPEMEAIFSAPSKHTILAVFADKEETGSDGVTGMQSKVICDVLDTVAHSLGANPIEMRYNSMCISADVTAAYDPSYPEPFDPKNATYLGCGAAISKYTGARGKSSTNDASAEYMAFIRDILDKEGAIWQTGELGAVDAGGGGTVAMYIANLGIQTVDVGVPVLSMHAPYEIISKADIYNLYLVCKAFCK